MNIFVCFSRKILPSFPAAHHRSRSSKRQQFFFPRTTSLVELFCRKSSETLGFCLFCKFLNIFGQKGIFVFLSQFDVNFGHWSTPLKFENFEIQDDGHARWACEQSIQSLYVPSKNHFQDTPFPNY